MIRFEAWCGAPADPATCRVGPDATSGVTPDVPATRSQKPAANAATGRVGPDAADATSGLTPDVTPDVPATRAQKLRSMDRPASADFSGWNCSPKTASRSTTLANVLGPVVVDAAVASP